MEKRIAIIFAGGVGMRMGVHDLPKQFLEINNKPIIIYTLEHFEKSEDIDEIYIGCIEPWIGYLKKMLKDFNITKVKSVIPGGNSGQDTIYRILKEARKYNDDNAIVLIHDGVRPYITKDVIKNNIDSVIKYGTAISTTVATETILLSEDGAKVSDVPIRKNMFVGQAPQSFRLGDIIAAHDEIRKTNPEYKNISDSCTLYHVLGKEVHMVKGNKGNLKVTDPIDYYILQAIIKFVEDGKRVVITSESANKRINDYEQEIK